MDPLIAQQAQSGVHITGTQVVTWLLPIVTSLLVLILGRVWLQSDKRLEAIEKRIDEKLAIAEQTRQASERALQAAIDTAKTSQAAALTASNELIQHVRRSIGGLNNLVTELRIRVERIDTQQQMRLFDRASKWKTSPPNEGEDVA